MNAVSQISAAGRRTDDSQTRIVRRASKLGHEIVELDGFLTDMNDSARDQQHALQELDETAQALTDANSSVTRAVSELVEETEGAHEMVVSAIAELGRNSQQTEKLASWVHNLEARIVALTDLLKTVESNTQSISHISKEVNILAINARIEAVRAGDAGRGFSVVAEAINSLASQTTNTAAQISVNIEELGKSMIEIGAETVERSSEAGDVIGRQSEIDQNLGRIQTVFETSHRAAGKIALENRNACSAMDRFMPAYTQMGKMNRQTFGLISSATKKTEDMVTASEEILQSAILNGGDTADARMIEFVTSDAAELSKRLEDAVARKDISEAALFSETYRPIPGTNPQQVITDFTKLTDRLFTDVQEAALLRSPEIVFCAAVDRNGYLPTHNKKFSHPQGSNPLENEAKSRNRRMFNDRVGLKAGRNNRPFLIQVYRRNMGGGNFAIMKDISAPITVNGKHWGGLRLAYKA